MPYDPRLADLLRDALDGHPGIEEKRMFGGICRMLDGNMLCGVEVGRFMFRVGKDRTEEALARPGTKPMEMGGRVMGGLVWVDAEAAIETGLDDWIVFASEFVGSLPAK
jgi:hypothetical protein